MNLKLLLVMIWIVLSFSAFSRESSHPIIVKIGCTYECDKFYKRALRRVSWFHNIKVEIFDLSRGPENRFAEMDGVLIPGGADIDPKYYLSYVETDLQEHTTKLDHLIEYSPEGKERDPFEYGFLKRYFLDPSLKDLPILGVCRGMQMLAVSQGIPLYVDIKAELGIKNRRYLYDRIRIEKSDSVINDLFLNSSFLAFKQHHQGIRVPYYQKFSHRWPNVKVSSYSNKKMIAESMEFTDRTILGVQFHPEKDWTFERKHIFGWLLKNAKERALKRRGEKGRNLFYSGYVM